jgi:hypothetical protein
MDFFVEQLMGVIKSFGLYSTIFSPNHLSIYRSMMRFAAIICLQTHTISEGVEIV